MPAQTWRFHGRRSTGTGVRLTLDLAAEMKILSRDHFFNNNFSHSYWLLSEEVRSLPRTAP